MASPATSSSRSAAAGTTISTRSATAGIAPEDSAAVEPLEIEVVRGETVESRHRVHAVAVRDGEVVGHAGDPELVTFLRSSAKPIQALPLARAYPDLSADRLAIACASHWALPEQLAAVDGLLEVSGSTEDDLECGAEGAPPSRLRHNCSGKHAGNAGRVPRARLADGGLPAPRASAPAAAARGGRGRRRSRRGGHPDGDRRLRRGHLRVLAQADGRCLRPYTGAGRRRPRRGRDAGPSRPDCRARRDGHGAHGERRRLGCERRARRG